MRMLRRRDEVDFRFFAVRQEGALGIFLVPQNGTRDAVVKRLNASKDLYLR